jgi:hypothetical protein
MHFFVPTFSSFICAFQGAAAADDGTGVLIGSWSGTGDWRGNGIKITTDFGKSWNQINGDMGTIPARYGKMVFNFQFFMDFQEVTLVFSDVQEAF